MKSSTIFLQVLLCCAGVLLRSIDSAGCDSCAKDLSACEDWTGYCKSGNVSVCHELLYGKCYFGEEVALQYLEKCSNVSLDNPDCYTAAGSIYHLILIDKNNGVKYEKKKCIEKTILLCKFGIKDRITPDHCYNLIDIWIDQKMGKNVIDTICDDPEHAALCLVILETLRDNCVSDNIYYIPPKWYCNIVFFNQTAVDQLFLSECSLLGLCHTILDKTERIGKFDNDFVESVCDDDKHENATRACFEIARFSINTEKAFVVQKFKTECNTDDEYRNKRLCQSFYNVCNETAKTQENCTNWFLEKTTTPDIVKLFCTSSQLECQKILDKKQDDDVLSSLITEVCDSNNDVNGCDGLFSKIFTNKNTKLINYFKEECAKKKQSTTCTTYELTSNQDYLKTFGESCKDIAAIKTSLCIGIQSKCLSDRAHKGCVDILKKINHLDPIKQICQDAGDLCDDAIDFHCRSTEKNAEKCETILGGLPKDSLQKILETECLSVPEKTVICGQILSIFQKNVTWSGEICQNCKQDTAGAICPLTADICQESTTLDHEDSEGYNRSIQNLIALHKYSLLTLAIIIFA